MIGRRAAKPIFVKNSHIGRSTSRPSLLRPRTYCLVRPSFFPTSHTPRSGAPGPAAVLEALDGRKAERAAALSARADELSKIFQELDDQLSDDQVLPVSAARRGAARPESQKARLAGERAARAGTRRRDPASARRAPRAARRARVVGG